MLKRQRRVPFVEYKQALEEFTALRRKINDCIDNHPEKFQENFEELKWQALYGNVVAMDVLAYYYKSGVPKHLPENYNRYMEWEIVAASRGNELAIDKLQFLIGFAYDKISEHAEFDEMVFKNDITEENVEHVLGKALCKIINRDFLKAFPIDLAKKEDTFEPYSQEAFVNLRKVIEDAIPKTIEFLLS